MNEGGLWKESISLCGSSMRGTLRQGFFTGDPEGMLSKALEMGNPLHKAPVLGNIGGLSLREKGNISSIRRTFMRKLRDMLKKALEMDNFLHKAPVLGDMGGVPFERRVRFRQSGELL
jgi:hypothetical protein